MNKLGGILSIFYYSTLLVISFLISFYTIFTFNQSTNPPKVEQNQEKKIKFSLDTKRLDIYGWVRGADIKKNEIIYTHVILPGVLPGESRFESHKTILSTVNQKIIPLQATRKSDGSFSFRKGRIEDIKEGMLIHEIIYQNSSANNHETVTELRYSKDTPFKGSANIITSLLF